MSGGWPTQAWCWLEWGSTGTFPILSFAASRTDHLYAGYLQIVVRLSCDFFLFVRLAFFFLCLRPVRQSAGYSNGVADMIGKRDAFVAVKLPMLTFRADEKKSSGFSTFL